MNYDVFVLLALNLLCMTWVFCGCCVEFKFPVAIHYSNYSVNLSQNVL